MCIDRIAAVCRLKVAILDTDVMYLPLRKHSRFLAIVVCYATVRTLNLREQAGSFSLHFPESVQILLASPTNWKPGLQL